MITKRIFAVTLGMLILASSTEIHQLLKLPVLITHYFNHRSQNNSLSFIAFLKIHYTSKHHPDDKDDREDNELPFKSSGTIFHTDIPDLQKKDAVNISIQCLVKPSMIYTESIPDHKSFSVFHPPRIS